MMAIPSPLSIIAAFLYMIVVAAAMLALVRAIKLHQVAWHKIVWVLVAAVFLCLALMRVFAIEELARSFFRGMLQSEGAYEQRRVVQGPLFVVVFTAAAAILAGLVYFVARGIRGRQNIAATVAMGCAAGMIFLLSLRILSFHAMDELLYGPLKLSWVGDIGMTIAVLGCAVRYATTMISGPSGGRMTGPRSLR